MKTIFCFLFVSLSCFSQEFNSGQRSLIFNEISLPIYYFPFYDSLQIIEVDYYTQSLQYGAMEDAIHPRGGSSFHDAMMMNRPNGYLIRNQKGEIVANYGVHDLTILKLLPPDSCKRISHKERLNMPRNPGFDRFNQTTKELYGNGYLIYRKVIPPRRSEMPEEGVYVFGILDTLGEIAIPLDHISINYKEGEYLVERFQRLFEQTPFTQAHSLNRLGTIPDSHKRFAIYDSTFKLTLDGSDIPIKRISKTLYALISKGSVVFIDNYGNYLNCNNYQYIFDAPYGNLMIYAQNEHDTLYQGLLSRQLEEITPAIYTAILPQDHGFILQDRNNRKGFLNLQGKLLVPCALEAETIDYRRDDYIVYTRFVTVPNGKMLCSGLIDSTGKQLLEPIYWEIGQFYTEITQVRKDNKWGLINRSGEVICPIIYDRIGQLQRTFIDVTKDGKQGLVDHSGTVILEPNFSYVNWYDSLIHCGNNQDEHFIYDLKTKKTYQHSFGKLMQQENGLSFYQKENKYGLVNAQGKLILPAQFDKVRAFRNNRAVVELNGKLGLIDQTGKIVQAIKYTDLSYDKEGNYVLE
ncbi:MAG: hypothetical protein RI922_1753 [Bacteroidota bacterium]|jgi:hypothetical protein